MCSYLAHALTYLKGLRLSDFLESGPIQTLSWMCWILAKLELAEACGRTMAAGDAPDAQGSDRGVDGRAYVPHLQPGWYSTRRSWNLSNMTS